MDYAAASPVAPQLKLYSLPQRTALTRELPLEVEDSVHSMHSSFVQESGQNQGRYVVSPLFPPLRNPCQSGFREWCNYYLWR